MQSTRRTLLALLAFVAATWLGAAVASAWPTTIESMRATPQGVWLHRPGALADWEIDAIRHADARTPIVLYNVPRRDCGSYSQGGVATAAQYVAWVRVVARVIGRRAVPVIVEPDALALMTCLGAAGRAARIDAIRRGVAILRRDTKAKIYVDAGKEGWHTPEEMAALLRAVRAPGFALNVSDFDWTSSEVGYGRRISRLTGGLHFVVDTSRNGAGPAPGAVGQDAWCNPKGRALGRPPTTRTGIRLVDAYLWIKNPGESDGECGRGEPAAGRWDPDYARSLVESANAGRAARARRR